MFSHPYTAPQSSLHNASGQEASQLRLQNRQLLEEIETLKAQMISLVKINKADYLERISKLTEQNADLKKKLDTRQMYLDNAYSQIEALERQVQAITAGGTTNSAAPELSQNYISIPEKIRQYVLAYYGKTLDDVQSKNSNHDVTIVRYMIAVMLCRFTKMRQNDIAAMAGLKGHSMVGYSKVKVADMADKDPGVRHAERFLAEQIMQVAE